MIHFNQVQQKYLIVRILKQALLASIESHHHLWEVHLQIIALHHLEQIHLNPVRIHLIRIQFRPFYVENHSTAGKLKPNDFFRTIL